MSPAVGKYIFFAGVVVACLGLIIWLFADKLQFFGNLPGDIRLERKNFRFYMPLGTMILLSIILSFLIWLFRKFFQ